MCGKPRMAIVNRDKAFMMPITVSSGFSFGLSNGIWRKYQELFFIIGVNFNTMRQYPCHFFVAVFLFLSRMNISRSTSTKSCAERPSSSVGMTLAHTSSSWFSLAKIFESGTHATPTGLVNAVVTGSLANKTTRISPMISVTGKVADSKAVRKFSSKLSKMTAHEMCVPSKPSSFSFAFLSTFCL